MTYVIPYMTYVIGEETDDCDDCPTKFLLPFSSLSFPGGNRMSSLDIRLKTGEEKFDVRCWL